LRIGDQFTRGFHFDTENTSMEADVVFQVELLAEQYD